ncbi:pyroglutamyl-peptidase I [Clostridium sp. 'deep sea']|uniref:pyroglutamyl-peptidase I n=1 Tax=Clostridium sp. 'deep sea' TaxID=2779445 RepID=UPI0018964EE4|nr:pyroglutamyl-peptidase I [Clostridium sp. 'deep sea']QOR34073.1 pyroglutamyl-peptidase I [Clostridium sp. 'deep sea']
MKILLTGYEPFGGESINPSWEAVKQFKGRIVNGAEIAVEEMPVVWNEIDEAYLKAINKHQPDVMICVGQAGGRNAIAIERVAVNRANGKDNKDVEKNEAVVKEDGADAYLSTLPISEMSKAVCEAGIPCYISNTAGLYLCNYIFYSVRHYAEKNNVDLKSVFIHIPYIPEQIAVKARPAKFPSMDLGLVVKALEQMLEVITK